MPNQPRQSAGDTTIILLRYLFMCSKVNPGQAESPKVNMFDLQSMFSQVIYTLRIVHPTLSISLVG